MQATQDRAGRKTDKPEAPKLTRSQLREKQRLAVFGARTQLQQLTSKMPFDYSAADHTRIVAWKAALQEALPILKQRKPRIKRMAAAIRRLKAVATATPEALAKALYS